MDTTKSQHQQRKERLDFFVNGLDEIQHRMPIGLMTPRREEEKRELLKLAKTVTDYEIDLEYRKELCNNSPDVFCNTPDETEMRYVRKQPQWLDAEKQLRIKVAFWKQLDQRKKPRKYQ